MAENKDTEKCPHLGDVVPLRQIGESSQVFPNIMVRHCRIDKLVCVDPRPDCETRKVEEANKA